MAIGSAVQDVAIRHFKIGWSALVKKITNYFANPYGSANSIVEPVTDLLVVRSNCRRSDVIFVSMTVLFAPKKENIISLSGNKD